MTSFILLKRHRTLSNLLCKLVFSRPMGGGPRTFPGGLNKWQWKRMHEKRAKEKEKRLLDQEKQLYQARIRSEIRSKLAGVSENSTDSDPSTSYSPMSPSEHIKALANRFMKEGAIDLWNEADGPLKTPLPRSQMHGGSGRAASNSQKGSISSPIDLKQLIAENRNVSGDPKTMNFGNVNGNHLKRNYSVQIRRRFRRNESSSSDNDSDCSTGADSVKPLAHKLGRSPDKNTNSRNFNSLSNDRKATAQRKMKLWRNGSSSSDYDSEEDSSKSSVGNSKWPRLSIEEEELPNVEKESTSWKDLRRSGSSASLGKFDMKMKRRVPPKPYDEESDFSEQVEVLRYELSKKPVAEEEGGKNEEIILTQKRFDECGISPLTVKALSSAGYVQMTRVQEATLPLCLEALSFGRCDVQL